MKIEEENKQKVKKYNILVPNKSAIALKINRLGGLLQ
jgi:hypothetical protein